MEMLRTREHPYEHNIIVCPRTCVRAGVALGDKSSSGRVCVCLCVSEMFNLFSVGGEKRRQRRVTPGKMCTFLHTYSMHSHTSTMLACVY